MVWFSLVGVYGMSTIVGYLMPNLVYTYIKYIWFVNTYDAKQSDGEAPVMLELWGMQSTPSLTSLTG